MGTHLFSGASLQGVTHRVSNPHVSFAAASRRMSVGFNLKPDYSAPAIPPPALRSILPRVSSDPSLDPAGEVETLREEAPLIGLVGRVGWQNHAVQTDGVSREEAKARFKPWKTKAVRRLREAVYGDACVF